MPRRTMERAPAGAVQTAKQARQAEREIIVTLRLPRDLHARLQGVGGPRGLTREIRDRLERSFADPSGAATDLRFADLLRSLGYAAAATAQLYPGDDARGTAVFHEAARRLVALYHMESGGMVFNDGMRGDVTGVMLMALGKLDAPPEFIRKVMTQMKDKDTERQP